MLMKWWQVTVLLVLLSFELRNDSEGGLQQDQLKWSEKQIVKIAPLYAPDLPRGIPTSSPLTKKPLPWQKSWVEFFSWNFFFAEKCRPRSTKTLHEFVLNSPSWFSRKKSALKLFSKKKSKFSFWHFWNVLIFQFKMPFYFEIYFSLILKIY